MLTHCPKLHCLFSKFEQTLFELDRIVLGVPQYEIKLHDLSARLQWRKINLPFADLAFEIFSKSFSNVSHCN